MIEDGSQATKAGRTKAQNIQLLDKNYATFQTSESAGKNSKISGRLWEGKRNYHHVNLLYKQKSRTSEDFITGGAPH